MFDYKRAEIVAGAFLIAGLAMLAYLSISIGGLRIGPRDEYHLVARFSNVGDLKLRAPVKIAGVTVGRVAAIRLADYYGEVELRLDRKVALPTDTIASIATAGLLGESHVALSPGAAEGNLADGGRITHTEPAINVADLLSRYAFGGGASTDGGGATQKPAPAPSKEEAP